MGIDHLALFVAAGIVLNLTPGPDVLYIVTNAMRSGARAGIVAALGITAGCFVHILAAAIGVSALMAASATAFTLLKWAGAAYLVFVGLRMLLARASAPGQSAAMNSVAACADGTSGKALKRVFFQGFWTNALNPKVALFFLAFVPQFIAPGVDNKPLAFLLLGLLFNFNALWVNIGWAGAAAWLAGRLTSVQQAMHGLERAAGLMFVGFGLKLAFSGHPVT
ncbi:LysE family translocator [Polaromonas glacialis]|uniref:LysE family translocator n=1 Tax=Polaromonas glacialis TaxID=866564 RepID=UPI00049780E3|nr:LysE family translocator [Polaromonas glacialis]